MPAYKRLRQEDLEFKASRGNTARTDSKKLRGKKGKVLLLILNEGSVDA